MKYLPIEYISIKHIDYLYKNDSITTETTNNILEALSVITPEKAKSRKNRDTSCISIVLYPDIPFGPDPMILAGKLFSSLEYSIKTVSDYYNIKRVKIFGWEREFSSSDKAIGFTKKRFPAERKYPDLTILEFYSLFQAAEGNGLHKYISISFFRDIGASYSFITSPPVNTDSLISGSKILEKLAVNDENTILSDPFSGKVFGPGNTWKKDFERDSMIIVSAGENGGIFRPKGSLWFSFPYFKRRITFRKGSLRMKEPVPCINCLACSDFCPSGLNPSYIYHYLITGNIDSAKNLNTASCILCGKCSFVCPSYLPIAGTIEEKMAELKEMS